MAITIPFLSGSFWLHGGEVPLPENALSFPGPTVLGWKSSPFEKWAIPCWPPEWFLRRGWHSAGLPYNHSLLPLSLSLCLSLGFTGLTLVFSGMHFSRLILFRAQFYVFWQILEYFSHFFEYFPVLPSLLLFCWADVININSKSSQRLPSSHCPDS